MKSTSVLKPPAYEHAQDFAKCISECLKSSLAVRSKQKTFDDLYEQLKDTRFDNTLQECIQAIFCSHSPSIPHNYWSEWYNTSCDSFHDMLTAMMNNDWVDDTNIGAKHSITKGKLVLGFQISIFDSDQLQKLEYLQRRDCPPSVRQQAARDMAKTPTWQKTRGGSELQTLKEDCELIRQYETDRQKDTLKQITTPAARTVAYRLVNQGKDPSPEQRRKWYNHEDSRYKKKERTEGPLVDLSKLLRTMRSPISNVVQAMKVTAQQMEVWEEELDEHQYVLAEGTRWAEGQEKDVTRRRTLIEAVGGAYRKLYDEARLERQRVADAQATAQATAQSGSSNSSPSDSFVMVKDMLQGAAEIKGRLLYASTPDGETYAREPLWTLRSDQTKPNVDIYTENLACLVAVATKDIDPSAHHDYGASLIQGIREYMISWNATFNHPLSEQTINAHARSIYDKYMSMLSGNSFDDLSNIHIKLKAGGDIDYRKKLSEL